MELNRDFIDQLQVDKKATTKTLVFFFSFETLTSALSYHINLKTLQLENQLNNILVHNNTDKDDGDIVQSMYPYGYFLLCSKKLILEEGGYWHNRGKKCMEVLASSTSLLGKLIWCQTSWER